jgi:signal transduction histidine kinase
MGRFRTIGRVLPLIWLCVSLWSLSKGLTLERLNRRACVVDPGHLTRNAIPRPFKIWGIVTDGKEYANRGAIPGLPIQTKDLRVNYTAGNLTFPERARFLYKLDGSDSAWQDGGTRRDAVYANLSPARYAFHVVASDNDGQWNKVGNAIDFTIPPAFHQPRWYYVVCTIAFMALLAVCRRARVHQVQARVDRLLEARLAERERIARELHDTVLQGLTSASLQLEVAGRQIAADAAAKPLVEHVSQLLRQLVDEGRHTVRGLRLLRSEEENLERALTQISKDLAAPRRVKYQVVVEGTPRSLRPLVREEIYRIGGEALANAFRHAGASAVETLLEYGRDHFHLLVRDDGQGIDPVVLKAGRELHFGLPGLRERAAKIGARLKVRTATGVGTEIDLLVPAFAAFEQTLPRGPVSWIAQLYSRGGRP